MKTLSPDRITTMAQSNALAHTPAMDLLQEPRLNKSTAFADAEREALGLTGLLPDVVESEDMQLKRVLQQLGHKTSDLDRYIYLVGPARSQRDPVLPDHDVRSGALPADRLRPDRRRGLPEVRPHLPPAARHVLSIKHKGRVKEILRNWPETDVRFICATSRRAHSRPRRSRRQRHGHSDRQAAALHRLRRRAAAGAAADGDRFRHQQRKPAQRSALSRHPRSRAPRSPSATRSWRSSCRRCRRCFRAAASISRIGRASTRCGCSIAIATRCAATTTTSRAPPARRWSACSARCGSPAAR